MKKGLLYGIVLGILLVGLAGCREYQLVTTKGDVASGQAAGVKKPVKEPSVDEIERAFHNAIQHEVYEYGDRDAEFSGRDMELYCKTEKDCYKYGLEFCGYQKGIAERAVWSGESDGVEIVEA